MASEKSDSDFTPLLLIGAAIAALVWLANRNTATTLVPAGAATSGAALPPGSTQAAGTTAGYTGSEVNPALSNTGMTGAMYQAGSTALTVPINTGAT